MTWGIIVVAAVLTANVADAEQRPAWYCIRGGGGCVASWPGEHRYSAFTSQRLCEEMQRWAINGADGYSAVGRCHPLTASQALR